MDFTRSLAMSSSLVKKSLSLFEDDLREEPEKKKKKKKSKDPMLAISTKKRGVKKELKRLQKQEQKITRRKTPQSSVYNDSGFDHTDASVKMLNRISQLDSCNRMTISEVTEHRRKKKKKKAAKSAGSTKEEEKSAFSEKDFENFSKDFDFTKLKKS